MRTSTQGNIKACVFFLFFFKPVALRCRYNWIDVGGGGGGGRDTSKNFAQEWVLNKFFTVWKPKSKLLPVVTTNTFIILRPKICKAYHTLTSS